MRLFLFAAVLLATTLLPRLSAVGNELGERDLDALTGEVIETVQFVIDHHVDPPSRNALLHAFCRTVVDGRPQLGLGRVFSTADEDQIRSAIAGCMEQIPSEKRPARVRSVLDRVLADQASTKIVASEKRRVDKQLEANRYVGIGIAIGQSDDAPTMLRVFEDGPADRGGAQAGDLIREVDGTPVSGMQIAEVVTLLRGPAGSELEVVVAQPAGERRTLKLTRDVVPLKQVEEFTVVEPGIATVKIRAITGSIVSDLRKLTPEIKQHQIKAIALDVRTGHAGFRPALMFANALIDGGPIGGIESESGIEPIVAERDQLWPGVAVAVVVNWAPDDAMAWALNAIGQHRPGPVFATSMAVGVPRPRHVWIYDEVDFGNRNSVAVIPKARLLGVKKDSGQEPAYVDLTRLPAMVGVDHQASVMLQPINSNRFVNSPRVPPVVHAVRILKRSLGDSRSESEHDAETNE